MIDHRNTEQQHRRLESTRRRQQFYLDTSIGLMQLVTDATDTERPQLIQCLARAYADARYLATSGQVTPLIEHLEADVEVISRIALAAAERWFVEQHRTELAAVG